MRKRILPIIMIISLLLLSACSVDVQSEKPAENKTYTYKVETVSIKANGVEVPTTVVMPEATIDGEVFPLVVMAHGHGGMRDASGGFTAVADGLGAKGIASIRMDFRGCGESKESFADNNITTILEDIYASIDFMSDKNIDKENIAILGYSMGGRAAILSSEKISYSAMATWAPASSNGATCLIPFMGGEDVYNELKEKAKADGSTIFTTRWGQQQELGYKWFTDLEETKPLDVISNFKKPMLILYGAKDDIILPEIEAKLIETVTDASENMVVHEIDTVDHGLGLYSEDSADRDNIAKITIDFLAESLLK